MSKGIRNSVARSGTGGAISTGKQMIMKPPASGAFSHVKAQMSSKASANLNISRAGPASMSQKRVET